MLAQILISSVNKTIDLALSMPSLHQAAKLPNVCTTFITFNAANSEHQSRFLLGLCVCVVGFANGPRAEAETITSIVYNCNNNNNKYRQSVAQTMQRNAISHKAKLQQRPVSTAGTGSVGFKVQSGGHWQRVLWHWRSKTVRREI